MKPENGGAEERQAEGPELSCPQCILLLVSQRFQKSRPGPVIIHEPTSPGFALVQTELLDQTLPGG